MNRNIVLCGVGGQGTVLASKLIAAAAMAKGFHVMSAETIGMAQRGGSVFSHLRIGEQLYSPMIALGTADMILAFEPGEAVRMLPYLKEGGQVVVSSRAVMPVTASLAVFSTDGSANGGSLTSAYCADDMLAYLKEQAEHVLIVDTDRACEALGSSKVLNVLMLGAAVRSGALGLDEEDMRAAIRDRLPEKLHALNFRALSYAGDEMHTAGEI